MFRQFHCGLVYIRVDGGMKMWVGGGVLGQKHGPRIEPESSLSGLEAEAAQRIEPLSAERFIRWR